MAGGARTAPGDRGRQIPKVSQGQNARDPGLLRPTRSRVVGCCRFAKFKHAGSMGERQRAPVTERRAEFNAGYGPGREEVERGDGCERTAER